VKDVIASAHRAVSSRVVWRDRRAPRSPAVALPSAPPAAAVAAPSGEPGELRISSLPSCEVLVDGHPVGATPVVGIRLPPGAHQVRLISSRFQVDKTYSVRVNPGEVTKKKFHFPADGP
jgi:hypothetical protein